MFTGWGEFYGSLAAQLKMKIDFPISFFQYRPDGKKNLISILNGLITQP